MPTCVRVGVFETNSSSTHSICITESDCDGFDTIPVDEHGTCRIYPGEFGWEVDEFRDAPTKASYCLTHVKNVRRNNGDDYRHRFSHDVLHYRERMLVDAIKERTGAKLVVFCKMQDEDNEGDYWGYIDHQSIEDNGGACEPAWESKETLANFIFNRGSILRTDNDNH